MKQQFHLIGLGGIGMSALSRILLKRGFSVSGSDAAISPLLKELQNEGARLHVGHRKENVPDAIVVYSSAVKEDNPERQAALERRLPIWHRSELLDFLIQGQKPLLITGTHGKTTTTALLAWVLIEAGLDPSYVVGGIARNLNTNGRSGVGAYFVAEADESDGSFLKTPSFGAIVTNCENDHLDFWKMQERLDAAFAQFFMQAQNSHHLFWCSDDPRLCAMNPPGVAYGFAVRSDLRVMAYRQEQDSILFDCAWKGKLFPDIALSLIGKHNALNGAAVFGLALSLGVPEEIIRKAFTSFLGTKRRLEFKGAVSGIRLFDDYAHHPTEIETTLRGVRASLAQGRLIAIFQPHRFTRTRDLWHEFATCFESVDLVILTEIYGAGEDPIPGITSEALAESIQSVLQKRFVFIPRNALEAGAAALLRPHDVVVTMGAGDITKSGEGILSHYKERVDGPVVAS